LEYCKSASGFEITKRSKSFGATLDLILKNISQDIEEQSDDDGRNAYEGYLTVISNFAI